MYSTLYSRDWCRDRDDAAASVAAAERHDPRTRGDRDRASRWCPPRQVRAQRSKRFWLIYMHA